MRGFVLMGALALLAPGAALVGGTVAPSDWAMNATVIEACSCPMFCQCYFNAKPASHAMVGHEHHGPSHFCRANNAYRINKGHYGDVALDGAKFWIATDLGGDFSKGEMDWAVLYYDTALTQPQRDAIGSLAAKLFPVKWRSFRTAEGAIDTWQFDKDQAVALLDGGRTGEVRLKRFPGMTDEPVVIKNLRYWGAPRNEGFVLMPNEVEAYRVGDKAFEFRNTNGFMLTLDMDSRDAAK
jgi:hypothetical protein